MAGVEEAQLHQFVGFDILNDLNTDLIERRTAQGEVIFEHPLGERFAYHRPGVFDPKALIELIDIRRGSHRRNAIHHSIGERHLGFQPGA